MAIPSTPPLLPKPIADSGDVRSIPDQTPIGSNQLSFQSGFPPLTSIPKTAGGVPPQREDFNAAYKLLSQHTFFQQSGGVSPWRGEGGNFPGLSYLAGWHVMGSDGHEYIAKLPSGPDVPDSGGGFVGPKNPTEDDGTYWLDFTAALQLKDDRYELCEFYYFRHPTLRPGFMPAQGGLVANAADLYPDAWAYLQTSEGQKLCKTEADWQAMTMDTWATLADGTKVGWNGIGGAPFYSPDTTTGALRLPDLRGMYAEAAGFDSLDVGGVHGDAIRSIQGVLPNLAGEVTTAGTGAFSVHTLGPGAYLDQVNARFSLVLDSSRVVPVAAKNQVRAWGSLACVYLGAPK